MDKRLSDVINVIAAMEIGDTLFVVQKEKGVFEAKITKANGPNMDKEKPKKEGSDVLKLSSKEDVHESNEFSDETSEAESLPSPLKKPDNAENLRRSTRSRNQANKSVAFYYEVSEGEESFEEEVIEEFSQMQNFIKWPQSPSMFFLAIPY